MSSSRHPIALSIERRVDDATKLLAVVMCLPLVDGIFPALVLAGALDSPSGIVEVGLLVFGGSATVAVVLAEMEGPARARLRTVLLVGGVVLPVAAIEAALAPTIAGVLNLVVFERFAAVVILAVAAKTASARVGEYLPRPAVIVGLGLVASVDPAGAALVVDADPAVVGRAVAAAAVGVGFAALVALASGKLASVVDLDRFRFGSAVALGVLALSILPVDLVPSDAPIALAVLAVTAVLSFDPAGPHGSDSDPGPESDRRSSDEPPAGGAHARGGEGEAAVDDRSGDAPDYDRERVPWL